MLGWCADSLVSIQVVSFIMCLVCIDVDVSDKFSKLFPLPSPFILMAQAPSVHYIT